MTHFIARLKENFASWLDVLALPTEVMGFASDPFIVATTGGISTRAKEVVLSIDEGKLILELVDLQSSLTVAPELRTMGPVKFWSDVSKHQFPNVHKVAIRLLSMFGSTYTCE